MEETITQSIQEFINNVAANPSFLYRGVTNKTFELIPSIAREWNGSDINPLISVERTMLALLKRRAIAYATLQPKNDWEWLMLGQHHGMPTRLLLSVS